MHLLDKYREHSNASGLICNINKENTHRWVDSVVATCESSKTDSHPEKFRSPGSVDLPSSFGVIQMKSTYPNEEG